MDYFSSSSCNTSEGFASKLFEAMVEAPVRLSQETKCRRPCTYDSFKAEKVAHDFIDPDSEDETLMRVTHLLPTGS